MSVKGLFWSLLVDLLFAVAASGVDDVSFPPLPIPDKVVVPADPTPPPVLAADELYPVDCRTECEIRTYPPGRLVFDKWDVGSVYAKFYGGGGKLERRKFAGPFLYVGRVLKAEGDVTVVVTPLGLKAGSEIQERMVSLGKTPRPPPDPNPDPKPDPVGPAPIPEAGFRILIVYERDDFLDLPPKQQEIIDGQKFRDFVDANCVKVGDQPEYRFFDKDVVFTGESEVWKKAMTRKRDSVPWLVVSNGKSGWEGPLPADTDAAVKLCSKYLEGK